MSGCDLRDVVAFLRHGQISGQFSRRSIPLQNSTGGKSRLGKVSKMGQKDIRSLLIVGAMSVVNAATRFGVKPGSWLARILDRKPKLLVAITLANRMARGIWAMLMKQEDYLNPEAVA